MTIESATTSALDTLSGWTKTASPDLRNAAKVIAFGLVCLAIIKAVNYLTHTKPSAGDLIKPDHWKD